MTHEVKCPMCHKTRTVSHVQFWRINKGLRKHCKSCSLRLKTYPGRKNPGNDGAAIAARMKGNSYAKGMDNTAHIAELALINKGNKYAAGIRGEAHHSWKGGTSGTERHRAMGQDEYKIWRSAIFKRDNYTCQVCFSYGGHLHADHIERWSKNEELRYSIENGRTLCRACHYYVTFKRTMPLDSKWGLTNVVKKEG